jgi:hypothetical protein
MKTNGFLEAPPDTVPLHGVAHLLGNREADARSPAVAAVHRFQQEKPPAAFFTTPDGQELRALAKPSENQGSGLAGHRQGDWLPL